MLLIEMFDGNCYRVMDSRHDHSIDGLYRFLGMNIVMRANLIFDSQEKRCIKNRYLHEEMDVFLGKLEKINKSPIIFQETMAEIYPKHRITLTEKEAYANL